MQPQRAPGLFDFQERINKLQKMNDTLSQLNTIIPWEHFRQDLNLIQKKERKSTAGAKPFDLILMFKILVLQQLNGLSDEGIEYQIRDRISFMRFLNLQFEDRIPDAKTVWLFREKLKNANLTEQLFKRFHEQLAQQGYIAKSGQMIDATFIETPKQRNTREENTQIKNNETPEAWTKSESKSKLRQKDTDARWTKKNNEKHYGYKNHINADTETKLITNYEVTHAAVHDSQVFDQILDKNTDQNGQARDVYADSAYQSKAHEKILQDHHIKSQICEKGKRNTPLTDEQKASNRVKSKTRARVEHVFGAQAAMLGHLIRTIGLKRAKVKVGLLNLTYNMKRLVQLTKSKIKAVSMMVLNAVDGLNLQQEVDRSGIGMSVVV